MNNDLKRPGETPDPKLKIVAAAVLREDDTEFFSELMAEGVDAVAPQMEKQIWSEERIRQRWKELEEEVRDE